MGFSFCPNSASQNDGLSGEAMGFLWGKVVEKGVKGSKVGNC